MATEVIMPKVDMVMDTGTFVEWLKKEGEPVKKGEPLFVVLTDKANIEVEAPAAGILAGVTAKPDDVIPVSQVIAYILEPGETLPAPAVSPAAPAPGPEPVPPTPESPGPKPAPRGGKVRATPAARHLAAKLGVNLAQVAGTGPRGRIHKANVLAFADRPPAGSGEPPEPVHLLLPDARQKQVVPLKGPRRVIARRLAHSAFTAPHIHLSLRVDMTEATRLRERVLAPLEQKTGRRVSVTAIIARAVAAVLPRHPYLNASLHGEEIILWEDVHLGIAAGVEDYLVVPVIRQAQTRNLEQLVTELGNLLGRARAKQLTPAEMSGSTFTISNLGMYGIESFTAIINPPETAILAAGKIVDTPVSLDGAVAVRPLMHLTLAADHRVVDGVAAARFLADLKTTLENPYLLI